MFSFEPLGGAVGKWWWVPGFALFLFFGSGAEVSTGPKKEPPTGIVLEGSVLDPEGEPIEGALIVGRLVASPSHRFTKTPPEKTKAPSLFFETRTAEGGRFRLALPSAGKPVIWVQASGWAPLILKDFDPARHLSLRLAQGAAVQGRLFDLSSGQGLAGATIVFTSLQAEKEGFFDPQRPDRFAHRGVTGDDGRFRITDLERGYFDVMASASGHIPQTRRAVDVGLSSPTPSSFFFYLNPGTTIAGVIRTKDGKNVEGATVIVQPGLGLWTNLPPGMTEPDCRGTSDKEGRFEVAGVPASTSYLLQVQHPDFATTWLDNVRVAEGKRSSPIAITLGKGGSVEAVFSDADKPFHGRIGLYLNYPSGEGKWRLAQRRIQRDPEELSLVEGRLKTGKLPPGEATLTISPEGFTPIVREKVLFREGETTDLGAIPLERGPVIQGQVTDEQGQGIAGAKVVAWAPPPDSGKLIVRRVQTDSEGEFVVGGLPEGLAFTVEVEASGFSPAISQKTLPPAHQMTIVLHPAGAISGRAVTGTPPHPAAGFIVEAWRHMEAEDHEPPEPLRETIQDVSGQFLLDNLPGGTYSLKISAEGLVPAWVSGLKVDPGNINDAGVLVLEEGVTVTGRIIERTSKVPVGGAEVRTELAGTAPSFNRDEGPPSGVVSDPEGRFWLRGLPSGKHTIIVDHSSYAPQRTSVDIQPDIPPAELTIELMAGGSIEGTILDATGNPAPGSFVLANGGEGVALLRTVTDETGHFRIDHLIPGISYLVSGASSHDVTGTIQFRSVSVEDGRTLQVDFGAGKEAVVVRGKVLRGRTPLAARMVWFPGDGTASRGTVNGRAEADGSFEIRLHAGGSYIVRILPAERALQDLQFDIDVTIPDKPEVEQDLVLPQGIIEGTVTEGETGERLHGVKVYALRSRTKAEEGEPKHIQGEALSDQDGEFRLEGLPAGSYRLAAELNGFGQEETGPISLEADQRKTERNLVLMKVPPLTVRVIDRNGRPQQGAQVVWSGAAEYERGGGFVGTDAEGRAVLPVLKDGTHRIAVVATGHAPAVRNIELVPPERLREMEVRLEEGVALTLHLLDAGGQPAPGLNPLILDSEGLNLGPLLAQELYVSGRGVSLRTDATGKVTFEHLEPGRYTILILRQGETVIRKEVELRAGEMARTEIKLP